MNKIYPSRSSNPHSKAEKDKVAPPENRWIKSLYKYHYITLSVKKNCQ